MDLAFLLKDKCSLSPQLEVHIFQNKVFIWSLPALSTYPRRMMAFKFQPTKQSPLSSYNNEAVQTMLYP